MSLKLNGSTYLSGIDMSSVVDSTQILIHFWIKPSNAAAGMAYIFDAFSGNRNYVRFTNTTNRLDLVIKDSASVNIARVFATLQFNDFEGWTPVDFIVDTSLGIAKCFINLEEDQSVVPTADALIVHNLADSTFCSRRGGANTLSAGTGIDQFYYSSKFDAAKYLTPEGNLTRQFMTDFYEFDNDTDIYLMKDSLIGESLNQDGSVDVPGPPIPEILFEGFFEQFAENRGSLADPTVVGVLEDNEDKSNVISV